MELHSICILFVRLFGGFKIICTCRAAISLNKFNEYTQQKKQWHKASIFISEGYIYFLEIKTKKDINNEYCGMETPKS